MTNHETSTPDELIEATLEAANVLLRVAARSVVQVEATVSGPQLRILVFIAREGPQSASAIAGELSVHASNATRMCDRLIRDGLLSRSEDRSDRRFVRLALTPAGTSLVASVFEQRRDAIKHVLDSIPAAQRAGVLHAFQVFAGAAGEEGAVDGRFALTLPRDVS